MRDTQRLFSPNQPFFLILHREEIRMSQRYAAAANWLIQGVACGICQHGGLWVEAVPQHLAINSSPTSVVEPSRTCTRIADAELYP